MSTPTVAGRPPPAPGGGRPTRIRRLLGATAVAAGMALAAGGSTALLTTSLHRPVPVNVGTLPTPQTATATLPAPATPAARPVRISIPGIGVHHSLTGLRVQQDGHLAVPDDPDQVGWWSDGPVPGDPGAAVIVGHVDSATGPAAFYGLSSLRPGDPVTVERADHSQVRFTVRALREYPKDAIPDGQVYATSGPPALRLITCGGDYDSQLGSYRDNLVVYATQSTTGPVHSTIPAPPHPQQ
ncbi:class F sortase [Streptomyces sp. SPB162]|uniref:class F sortase n=1 Tax=Streptomyces sp. SPB162 TaxID=2940560 RepID=UPI002406A924|nr:class F sortase [Streptomyces sp. SPB162]MDF9816202.1 sortase (surface protein transpeptidase) [Streptomyces sp. SPB162]